MESWLVFFMVCILFFLNCNKIFKSSSPEDELFTDQTLEVVVTADDTDWGSSDSVSLEADQSENWTVTEAEPGLRFR